MYYNDTTFSSRYEITGPFTFCSVGVGRGCCWFPRERRKERRAMKKDLWRFVQQKRERCE